MPIKFRCGNCNQLMGIARRKAGSQVRCSNCRHPVTVPADDPGESPVRAIETAPSREPAWAAGPVKTAPAPALFEQSDIDELIRPPQIDPQPYREPAIPPPAPAWTPAAGALPGVDVVPVDVSGAASALAAPIGYLVTPRRMTVLIVLGLLLLGAAFGAGLCVGRYVLGA